MIPYGTNSIFTTRWFRRLRATNAGCTIVAISPHAANDDSAAETQNDDAPQEDDTEEGYEEGPYAPGDFPFA